jgi:hypothetical protein
MQIICWLLKTGNDKTAKMAILEGIPQQQGRWGVVVMGVKKRFN